MSVDSVRPKKPNYKLWGLWSLWSMSLLFLLFQGGKLAYMLFIIMTVLGLYLMLGRWSGVMKAKGTRQLINIPANQEIHAGTALEVKVSIQIPGFWPIPYVVMKDFLSRKNEQPQIYEFSLVPDWKRRGSVVYRTKPLRRGYYTFDQFICSTEDIFGFFKHEGTIPMKQSFVVIPKTVHIKQWNYFEQMQRGFHHQSQTTRKWRETTQINGVRDYVYGDKLTRIHWNATARTGEWKSKEFERESLPKTIFVLDRNKHAYPDEEAFELAVSTTASLLKFGRNKAIPQGLLSYGRVRTFFETGTGKAHAISMLRHLTEVEADATVTIHDAMKEHCAKTDKGSFFVIITGENGNQMESLRLWLQNIGHQYCHIWITPSVDDSDKKHYSNALTSKGYRYPVSSLYELPDLLEGR